MSWGNRGVLHVGTIAVNRYTAGWVTPEQVHVYDGGFDRVQLSVDWEPGTQMIVLPTGKQGNFLSLGARVAKNHDSGIPKEGVESYLIQHDQCHAATWGEACWGISRRQTPWPHDTETTIDENGFTQLKNPLKHVLGVGQSLEWNNITVTVTDRIGDQWVVEISDGTETPPPVIENDIGLGDWFVDDDGNTHEASINRFASLGITVGCRSVPEAWYCPDQSVTRAEPDQSVTRAEMAAFVLRSLGQGDPTPAKTNVFTDVAGDKWYTKYVHQLAEMGVGTGSGDTWRPNDPLTRREMAHWLVAAFDHITPVPAPLGLFDDVAREDWEIVEGVFRVGVTFGCTTDPLMYCPDQPVTRAQMASFIIRALQ